MTEQILIIIGSESDRERTVKLSKALDWFGVSYHLVVSSAHRQPAQTIELAANAEAQGYKVIIAAAGMSAHLPGVIAANTILPVIGIPLDASPLKGVDALYSIIQMPPGVPVAAVGIDGTLNAGLLAVRILALENKQTAEKLKQFIAAGCKF